MTSDPARRADIYQAISEGDIERVELILHRIRNLQHLQRDASSVTNILSAPLEYDASGNTALHLASRLGYVQICACLVREGGDDLVHARNSRHKTPLHLAATAKHSEVVEWLLQQGANVHAKDYGEWTALHFACLCWFQPPCLETIRVLLNFGANVNEPDNELSTPLHTFVRLVREGYASTNVLTLLLERGADPNTQLQDGTTILQSCITREQCPDAYAQCLLENGAVWNGGDEPTLLLELLYANVRLGLLPCLLQQCPHDFSIPDRYGYLPVHVAAVRDRELQWVYMLVRYQPMLLVDSYHRESKRVLSAKRDESIL